MPTAPLSDSKITDALASLDGWTRDGDSLVRTFKFETYLAGVAFASAAGVVCEGLDHHPDMLVGWRKVTLTFTTHDAGNKISAKDVAAAKAVDALGYPKGK
jgi:4a-hydroxytetrahydrobiopterin dehydratase